METNKPKNVEEELKKVESKATASPKEDVSNLLTKAKQHIAGVRDHVLKFAGKAGHNPWIWLNEKGFTLAEQMVNNPGIYNEDELARHLVKILSIKAEDPRVMSPPIMERKVLKQQEEAAKKKGEK